MIRRWFPRLREWDGRLFRWCNRTIRHTILDRLFGSFTHLGGGVVLDIVRPALRAVRPGALEDRRLEKSRFLGGKPYGGRSDQEKG